MSGRLKGQATQLHNKCRGMCFMLCAAEQMRGFGRPPHHSFLLPSCLPHPHHQPQHLTHSSPLSCTTTTTTASAPELLPLLPPRAACCFLAFLCCSNLSKHPHPLHTPLSFNHTHTHTARQAAPPKWTVSSARPLSRPSWHALAPRPCWTRWPRRASRPWKMRPSPAVPQ